MKGESLFPSSAQKGKEKGRIQSALFSASM
jgi:hypothetical protein